MFAIKEDKKRPILTGEYSMSRGIGSKKIAEQQFLDAKNDFEEQARVAKGFKNQIGAIKDNFLNGQELGDEEEQHYMECFPQFQEEDF